MSSLEISVGSSARRPAFASRTRAFDPALFHARLDAARGLSAIVVLLDHTQATLLARIAGSGQTIDLFGAIGGRHAVMIFFLLSGHLITSSILGNVRRNGSFSAGDYMLSRLTRIYPPLIGSILLCLLVWAILFAFHLPGSDRPFGLVGDLYASRDHYTIAPQEILTSMTMQGGLLQVNGPLWSLYVEFQLYIVALAVAVWWCTDRSARYWGAILGVLAASYLLDQPFMVGVWLLGATTAVLARYRKTWLALGTLAGLAILVLEGRHTHLDGVLKEANLQPTLAAFSLLYSAFLFFVPPRFAIPKAIAKTADFSYSLYIIHAPLLLLVLALTQDWTGHSLARALLVSGAVVPVILVIAKAFASVAENQAMYKRWVRTAGPREGKPAWPKAPREIAL